MSGGEGQGDTPEAISVTGLFSLNGGPEHPCRAEIAVPERFRIATAETVRGGEAALCRLDGLGLITGRVDTLGTKGFTRFKGFALIPDLCPARRERVEARIAWLAARNRPGGDLRSTPRIVPLLRSVTVRLPDGFVAAGEIDDLSKTGARVRFPGSGPSLPWLPGMQVTVGKRYAVVVRTEAGVIAVRFRLPFTDDTFNPSVVL